MSTLLRRSILVLALLFGLVFAVGTAVLYYVGAPVQYAVLLALAVVSLQYAVGPFLIEWIFSIGWTAPEALGPETAAFLRDLCGRLKIPVPRIGIIEDGRPNAFTFGHTPRNARVVVTRGLLEMLPPDEVQAVVAHEMGHVRNWDFVVMTLASSVPLILYVLYQWTYRDRRGRDGGYAALVGIGAYIAYIISQYLVLFLSRIREYYADRFAALSTGQPQAMSRALVRISYGLAKLPPVKKEEQRRSVPATALGSLGIASARGAGAFAVAAADAHGQFCGEAMARAMRWDLTNPWARWFEWHSTHPLTARRIREMNALTPRAERRDFSLRDVPSYWPKFWADLLFASLPWLGILAGVGAGAWVGYSQHPGDLMRAAGIGLALAGLGWLLRLRFEYPGGGQERDVASLVGETEVSHLRAIPVTVRGTIIGRGVPGLFYSEDLVLQDETGFITLDYRQPFRLLEVLFGWFKADRLIGRPMIARGWYRRGPAPVIELKRADLADGTAIRCYHLPTMRTLAVLLLTAGILLLLAAG